jgi:hypothetical protein
MPVKKKKIVKGQVAFDKAAEIALELGSKGDSGVKQLSAVSGEEFLPAPKEQLLVAPKQVAGKKSSSDKNSINETKFVSSKSVVVKKKKIVKKTVSFTGKKKSKKSAVSKKTLATVADAVSVEEKPVVGFDEPEDLVKVLDNAKNKEEVYSPKPFSESSKGGLIELLGGAMMVLIAIELLAIIVLLVMFFLR